MSLSNLYFRGCFEQPSQEQIDALANVPNGDVDGIKFNDKSEKFELDVVDKSCVREDLNTCGKSIQDIILGKERIISIDSRVSPRGDLNIENDYILIPNHGLTNGQIAYYSTENQAIGGLIPGKKYFIKSIHPNAIELYPIRDLLLSERADLISGSIEENQILSVEEQSDRLLLVSTINFQSGDSVYYHCNEKKIFDITAIDTIENTFTISNFNIINDGDIVLYFFNGQIGEEPPFKNLNNGDRFFVKKISPGKISLYQYEDLSDLSKINLSDDLTGSNFLQRTDNIGGLVDNNNYYVKVVDSKISLHTSRDLSEASKINIFGAVIGSHSIVKVYKHFLTIPPITAYSTQKGLYKTWGDIEFPWEISPLTPDLFFEFTNDKWSISTYRKIAAYSEGERVFLIEDDGYELGLYEANQDILSISGPFDYSKWDKICGVKTTAPVGLPTPEELRERYAEYALGYFYDGWDEVDSTWSEGTYELALQNCQSQGGTLEDFEKCMRDSSSDVWKDARVRREFFYKRGDIVRVEAECGDTVCIWIAIQDMPATEAVYAEYVDFKPGSYWQKIYCVNTKANRCLEYQRKKEPTLGYDVVQIGSLGHYVEVPVPYRLKPTAPSLDERAEIRRPPAVLTQEQIDALTQPTEE